MYCNHNNRERWFENGLIRAVDDLPGTDELKKKMTPANLDSLKSKDGSKLLGLRHVGLGGRLFSHGLFGLGGGFLSHGLVRCLDLGHRLFHRLLDRLFGCLVLRLFSHLSTFAPAASRARAAP